MLTVILKHMHILAKAVNNDTDKRITASERNIFLNAAKHSESLFPELCHIKVVKKLRTVTRYFCNSYINHLVYTIMTYLFIILVISYQIVILIIPHKRPWAYVIFSFVVARFKLFLNRPLGVHELNRRIGCYGCMYLINIVIYTLIHSLWPVIDIYLAL